MKNEKRTVIHAGEPGYEEWIGITEKLRQHRKTMHALWKRREALLVAAGRPAASYMAGVPVFTTTPEEGKARLAEVMGAKPASMAVTIPPAAVASFSAAPAGAPRAVATVNPVADKVRALFTAHPGVAFTASAIAQAIGLGERLRGPAQEAVKALVRAKEVSEVGRGKYARVHDATAADLK